MDLYMFTVCDYTIVSTGCDQRWHLFDGHCYRYVQTFANWNEAKVVNLQLKVNKSLIFFLS